MLAAFSSIVYLGVAAEHMVSGDIGYTERMGKPSFAAAISLGSALLLAGWAVLHLSSLTGPGQAWTIGHMLLLAGYAALLIGGLATSSVVAHKKPKGPTAIARRCGVGLLVLGAGAFAGQLLVDLVVGFTAANQADMDRLFDGVQSHLVLQLSLYSVGPALFYTGLLVLVALLVAVRGATVGRGICVIVGIVLIGIAFSLGSGGVDSPLYVLGLACLTLGFLPFRSLPKS